MKHHRKELGELLNKAESFGRRLEGWGKNIVIFPNNQTVRSDMSQNEAAFHEPPNLLQRDHERHNTDVTQMIF